MSLSGVQIVSGLIEEVFLACLPGVALYWD